MDPQTVTVAAGGFANQELEEFAMTTLRKLVELEEDEGYASSSLRLSAQLDLGMMRDENGWLGHFVNEVEWGVSTALYSQTRPQNVLCYADTYYPPCREWVQLVSTSGECAQLLSEIHRSVKTTQVCHRSEGCFLKQQSFDLIIAQEEHNKCGIGAVTWWAYLKATGGATMTMAIQLFLEIILLKGSVIMLGQWLTWWTEDTWHEKWIGVYSGISPLIALRSLTYWFVPPFYLKSLHGLKHLQSTGHGPHIS
ncbi:hypothetical protein BU15DRAFT_82262 [Melanogaster broomeanus]|nr:hypothetical protein BU15DRAFT_82262 [Melanogaster broomeanus]